MTLQKMFEDSVEAEVYGDVSEATESEVMLAELEAEQAEDVSVEALHVAASLESVLFVLDQAVYSQEALTPVSTGLLMNTLDDSAQRLGVSVESLMQVDHVNGSVSVESLSGSTEGLVDTIKKVWEAIVKSIKDALTKVMDFIRKLFGGLKKMKGTFTDAKAKLKNHDIQLKDDVAIVVKGNRAQYMFTTGNETIAGAIETQLKGINFGKVLYNDYVTNVDRYYVKAIDQNMAEKFAEYLLEENVKADVDGDANSLFEIVGMLGDFDNTIKKLQSARGFFGDHTAGWLKIGGNSYLAIWDQEEILKSQKNRGKREDVTLSRISTVELLSLTNGALDLIALLESKKSKLESINKAREKVLKKYDEYVKAGDRGPFKRVMTKLTASRYTKLGTVNIAKPFSEYNGVAFRHLAGTESLVKDTLANMVTTKESGGMSGELVD